MSDYGVTVIDFSPDQSPESQTIEDMRNRVTIMMCDQLCYLNIVVTTIG